MSQNRITLNLQEGTTPEETSRRVMQELIRLQDILNNLKLPIVVGPNDNLPEGMLDGQPVIDWRTGVSSVKIWDGASLV